MTRRDPAPAASFNEPPTVLSPALWAMRNPGLAVPLPVVHRPPDLFERLRASRSVGIRLTVDIIVVLGGVALLVGIPPVPAVPPLGLALLLVGTWAAVCDALLLARIRRSIAEAWVDLAWPDEGA